MDQRIAILSDTPPMGGEIEFRVASLPADDLKKVAADRIQLFLAAVLFRVAPLEAERQAIILELHQIEVTPTRDIGLQEIQHLEETLSARGIVVEPSQQSLRRPRAAVTPWRTAYGFVHECAQNVTSALEDVVGSSPFARAAYEVDYLVGQLSP